MKNNKVFINASWIIGCKIAQSGLALLLNALTARYFGPSNFGLINYAASLVTFITPIMTLGTSETLVNEIIKNPDREGTILGTAMTMTFLSSLVCITGLSAFVRFVNPGDPVTIRVVSLYSLLLIAQSFEQIQYWFHAKYLSKLVAVVWFFAYLAVSIYKIVLLAYQKSIYWFAIANSLDYLLIAIGLLVIYKKKRGQRLAFSVSAARSLWSRSRYYILAGLMGEVIIQSDRFMLRHMCGDAEVGFYSAALSISCMTGFAFSAIITAFRPAILEAKKQSNLKFERGMAQLYGIIIYLAVAQSIMFTIVAKPVVRIMYGQDYMSAVPILQIVVWYTIFSYIGGIRAIWTLAENKQRYIWGVTFAGMMFNVLLNWMLIPKLQGIGAAVATLATQVFTNLILVYLLKPLRENITYMRKGMNLRNLFTLSR